MAIQAPPKPETRLPGEIWKAFVRSKPNDPRIEQAIDYAVKHNHPLFNTTIKTIDAAAKPDGLWDDLLAMLHEEEDHKELHTERGHADNEHENMHDASGEGKALGSILSAFKEPKFMEEDPEFWELVKKEEKAWDEKNPKPGNDATEEEKLAYEQDFVDAKYGSLDDPESTSFQKLAGEKFEEEHSGEKEKQENKTPDPKKVAKWNTYQAYRNTPISFGKDHEIGHVRHSINEEAAARLRVLQKSGLKGTDLDQSYNAVLKRIKQKHWTKFVETHQGEEGKAEAYAKEAYKNKQAQKDFDDFKKAHEAWEKEKALKATKEDQTRQTPPETSPVLSEKEKLEQEFLQFKKEWAQKKETTSIIAPPQKIPAHPLYKTTPGQPSILPQVKPILPPAKNMPSQGIIRPGANASSVPPQQNLRPSQGQTRTPGFRFSLPRLRIPSNRNPVMSPQPRQPGLDRLNSGLTNGVNALQTGLNTFRNAEKLLSGLRGGAFLFNPTAIVIGVILLLIILLLFGFLTAVPSFNTTVTSLSPTPAPATTTNGIPGLTLTLTGPTAIANSDNIQYTINASYTGTAEITLTDTFPPNTQLVNATGIHTKTDTTVVWKLSENEATGTSPKVYIFTIVLAPNKEDILVKNKIIANATGGTGGGTGSTLPSNPNATDFATLMRGQGRNTGVLGDEDAFVSKILASRDRRVDGKESFIRQIYQAAVAKGVNPLVVVTDWGLESGYATGGAAPFGCDPPRPNGSGGGFSGFETNLSCSINTWNYFMKEYDKKAAEKGVPVRPENWPAACSYDDPFLYAAEWYGPVCHAEDGNGRFQGDFYTNYTMFLGQ